MAQKQNANIRKDALFEALSDKQADCPLSDEQLYALIERELAQPADGMDVDIVDACYCLLERRHSPFGNRHLAKSEKKSLTQFKRFMKQHSVSKAKNKSFPLKPLAVAALVVLMVGAPALYVHQTYRVSTSPNEQQYTVVGLQTHDVGLAKAGIGRSAVGTTMKVDSLEAIPAYLGYTVELPTWLPEGCTLKNITLDRGLDYDSLYIVFAGDHEKKISISLTLFSDRSGHSISYEQEKKGHQRILENGISVYVANNINSVWGIIQSSNKDYSIDAIGFDETTLIRIFNSIAGKKLMQTSSLDTPAPGVLTSKLSHVGRP